MQQLVAALSKDIEALATVNTKLVDAIEELVGANKERIDQLETENADLRMANADLNREIRGIE